LRLVLDEPKDDDDSYEVEGLTYLISKDLSTQSGAVKVDFIDNGWQQGFSVTSEKPIGGAESACGTSCSC
jgi:iron-sulfur cluster assembly protein